MISDLSNSALVNLLIQKRKTLELLTQSAALSGGEFNAPLEIRNKLQIVTDEIEQIRTEFSKRNLPIPSPDEKLEVQIEEPNAAVVEILNPPVTDTGALMKALRAITEDEFESLCLEGYPIVQNTFSSGQSMEQKRRLLVQWIIKHGYARKLIADITAINPQAFQGENQ